jgi:hypothetical protein
MDTRKCYQECERKEFFEREFVESTTIEQVQEFYEFLQGNRKETICKLGSKITWKQEDMPKLSQEQAFAIIYYLQEALYILPDHYEKCKKCGDLFDSENDGCLGGYCDGCGCQHDYDSFENGCDDCPEAQ